MNSCTHCETRSSCFFTTLVAVAVVVAAAAAVAGAVVVSFQFVLNTLPVDGFTLVFLGTKSKQTCSSWHFNSNEEEFKSIIKTIPTATKTHSESRRRKNGTTYQIESAPIFSSNRETKTYFPFVVIIIFNNPPKPNFQLCMHTFCLRLCEFLAILLAINHLTKKANSLLLSLRFFGTLYTYTYVWNETYVHHTVWSHNHLDYFGNEIKRIFKLCCSFTAVTIENSAQNKTATKKDIYWTFK